MKRNEYNPVGGPIGTVGTTRAEMIQAMENLNRPSDGETLSGAGIITLGNIQTYLTAESGAYAVTLTDGNARGMEKELIFDGSDSSSAVFTVTGTLRNFSAFQLSASGRVAILRWTGAKWSLAGGDVITVS